MFNSEKIYIFMPKFAAKLYEKFNLSADFKSRFEDIAKFICSKINKGNLLDVGSGPGDQLFSINKLNPDLNLYGIDISFSMTRLAQKKLSGKNIKLEIGTIEKTNFDDNFFDCIIGSGSLYLWDNKIKCLEEIYRILKKDQKAYFFEIFTDFDKIKFNERLKNILKGKNIFSKFFIKFFLNQPLTKAYTFQKYHEIIENSKFKDSFKIEKISFDGFDVWIRIELTK